MIHDEIERARDRLADGLVPAVADLFAQQGDLLADLVEAGDPAAAEDVARDLAYASEAVALTWGATAPPFAGAVYEGLAPAKKAPPADEWLQRALAFLAAEGGVMVSAITDTVLSDLRGVLSAGIAEGRGVREIAADLRATWPDLTAERAERIVRTEVMAASNAASEWGAERAADDFDLEMEKEWLSAPDDGRRRDSHAEADGQRVRLGETFEVGGERARYPGDPKLSASERVRCRCAVAYVPAGEKALSWRQARDARIRSDYPALRESEGQTGALLTLAEREGVSERTVRRALWE